MKKIEAMHHYYGSGEGKCEDCPHFIVREWGRRRFFKCSVYGCSHSTASDWAKSYPACGLKDKPFPAGETRIINRMAHMQKVQDEQLPGQLMMEFWKES